MRPHEIELARCAAAVVDAYRARNQKDAATRMQHAVRDLDDALDDGAYYETLAAEDDEPGE